MFRFTQEPSSGSYFVLSYNYNYDSIVLVLNDVVIVMAAYQPVVQACGIRYTVYGDLVPPTPVV